MTAVLRLVWTYFTATPLARGLTLLGLVLIAIGVVVYAYVPTWTLGTGMRQDPLWLQSVLLTLPWFGLILLFFSSISLPRVIERLALGRLIRVLPGGRAKLLASAVLAAALLAALTAAAATIALGLPTGSFPARLFVRSFLIAFVDFGMIYLAIWVIGKTRGIWLLMGSVLVLLGVTIPLGAIGSPSGIPAFVALGLLVWVMFGAVLLYGVRIRQALGGVYGQAHRFARGLRLPLRYAPGRELDLMLGTARPWVAALGQIVPIAVAAAFIWHEAAGLLYLTLFSALAGAATSHAAARSRRLWLCNAWARPALFRRVEVAYLLHGAYSLGVLLLAFAALAAYLGFSARVSALGPPLLVAGAVVTVYLGLVMTRGLGAFEVAAAIATTLLLMATAIVIADPDTRVTAAVSLLAALAALALAYRGLAKARWHGLDWRVCRDEVGARRAA